MTDDHGGAPGAATAHSGKAVVTLPNATDIVITRSFDAPRDLVYRAVTTPELVRRWWAGRRGTVTLAEIDLRVGGRWRYVMVANGGFEVAFHGEYLDLRAPELIVSTEIFDPFPDAVAVNTVTLTEVDGRTELRVHVRHATPQARDGHIASGMESGMQESYDALEQVARSLQAEPVS